MPYWLAKLRLKLAMFALAAFFSCRIATKHCCCPIEGAAGSLNVAWATEGSQHNVSDVSEQFKQLTTR